MLKILITGANGLLGQKLVFLLAKSGNMEIIATGRGPARSNFKHSTYLDIDLTNRKDVFSKISRIAPTHIIHCAALTQVDLCEIEKETCWLSNVVASENLIEVASELNSFFNYVSTDFIFDGKRGPYAEDDLPNPINFYGKSKHAVEQILLNGPLDHVIIRTVLIYGVGQNLSRSNLVLWVKTSLENNKAIRVVNDQWRTPTLAEDLALGCQLIIEKRASGIFHLSGKEYVTPYDIAIRTADIFGLDKNLISPTNASEFKEVGTRPLKTGFDISKARRELGYQPRSLDEGLRIVKEQART